MQCPGTALSASAAPPSPSCWKSSSAASSQRPSMSSVPLRRPVSSASSTPSRSSRSSRSSSPNRSSSPGRMPGRRSVPVRRRRRMNMVVVLDHTALIALYPCRSILHRPVHRSLARHRPRYRPVAAGPCRGAAGHGCGPARGIPAVRGERSVHRRARGGCDGPESRGLAGGSRGCDRLARGEGGEPLRVLSPEPEQYAGTDITPLNPT